MRVFALELDNGLKGVAERKAYIEGLIARLPAPDLVGMEAPIHSKSASGTSPSTGRTSCRGTGVPAVHPEA